MKIPEIPDLQVGASLPRLMLALLLAALTLAAAACRSTPAEPAGGLRWIEGAPADELMVAQLSDVECLVGSTFEGRRPGDGLTLADAFPLENESGQGLTVRGGELAPRLVIDRTFGPGEIDAVRLAVAGVRRGNVRVRWTVPGSPAPAGNFELPKSLGAGTIRNQFFFDLSGRLPPGEPVRLEIEPTTVAGELVTLTDLCIGRARLDSERLAVAARVAWKATLADEARDVLVQPAAGQIEKSLVLPSSARLTTGFGRLAGRSTAVRLRATVAGIGEDPRILFERVVGAAELAGGWVDLAIDLAAAGSGLRQVALSATPDPPGDAAFVGVWSSPRISSPEFRSGRPNIVLISLDTLRADHLSLYGYARPTTPRLDSWARERNATVFRQVVAPSGWTLPSHFSLFTGIEAFRHPGNYNNLTIDASAFDFLAERLLAAGYRTQAFTGGGFVHPIYGLAKGFESFAYWASKETRTEELESNLERADKWLDSLEFSDGRSPGSAGGTGDPFLLFLHTYEIHTPNPARQPYFGQMSRLRDDLVVDIVPDTDLVRKGFLGNGHSVTRAADGKPAVPLAPELANLPIDLYDSAIAYVDDHLSPFLRRLSEPPFVRDTIVVIFSDHGESLGEGGRAGHANLALNNLLVPLVVVLPGARQGRDVASQVRLFDLFPTLLELAGAEVPAGIDAQSLQPLLAGEDEPAGRPAWAYSGLTNHGLSLVSPGGLKLDWRNSVWRPIAGDLLWFRHAGFEEIALAEAPTPAEAERMVRQLQQPYARDASGLRFKLENRSERPAKVAILSDLIDPTSVKSPVVGGASLDWQDIGYLSTQIPTHGRLELQFERTQRREIELTVEVSPEACPERKAFTAIAATVDQLRGGQRRQLELPACPGAVAGAVGGALELNLVWQGALPAAKGERSDEKLREDLRALGYLH
ncbi:MAG: sulfatase [Thermoanaerobaculia bacterium]|nr:sulfatase [Thermoanaerobaculia bacterium]